MNSYLTELLAKHELVQSHSFSQLPVEVRDSVSRSFVALRHFFTGMSHERAAILVRRIIFSSMWSSLDVRGDFLPWFIARTTLRSLPGAQVIDKQHPAIFFGCHIEAYKLVPAMLTRLGYKLLVPVSPELLQGELGAGLVRTNELARENHWAGHLDLVDAGDRNVLGRMIKHVRKGGSIFVYPDGNSGTGGISRRDEKLSEVDFLETRLRVRKGIAAIAWFTGLGLTPVKCERLSSVDREIVVYPTLATPDRNMERDRYLDNAMQQVFDFLAGQVHIDPGVWESSLYALQWVVPARVNSSPPGTGALANEAETSAAVVQINQSGFELARFSDGSFLVDVQGLRFIKLNEFDAQLATELFKPKSLSSLNHEQRASVNALFEIGAIEVDRFPEFS